MTFTHPLARDAKVWPTGGESGQAQRVLVIITTLELDEKNKNFKETKVQRLCEAAKEWLSSNASEASDYMLVNRAKDWS